MPEIENWGLLGNITVEKRNNDKKAGSVHSLFTLVV